MRTSGLRTRTIPKIALVATALAGGLYVATVDMPSAQAYSTPPSSSCAGCHSGIGGSVTATPSSATVAPGAAYTVELAITTTATGTNGYWISGNGANAIGNAAAGATRSAAMTAPTTAGSYTYTVWVNGGSYGAGQASSTTFSITVGAATPTPTTTAPVPTTTTTAPVPTTTTTAPVPTTTTTPPVILPTVSGDVDMSPTGALGKGHLSMYSTFGAMSCAACHNGTSQPKAPALAIEDADMERGVSCATCHAPGTEEADEPIFVSEMNDPMKTGKLTYSRCSDCHTIVADGDSDDDSNGGSDDD